MTGAPHSLLLDVLRTMRLTGGIFIDYEFTAPWCVTASAIGQFEDQEPISIESGEVVIFPRNDRHKLGSDLSLNPVSAKELVLPPANGSMARIEYGGGGESAHIMCGFLGTDTPNDPVLGLLPPVLKLEVNDGASGDWIESSLRFAARQMATGRAGSPAILAACRMSVHGSG